MATNQYPTFDTGMGMNHHTNRTNKSGMGVSNNLSAGAQGEQQTGSSYGSTDRSVLRWGCGSNGTRRRRQLRQQRSE